MFKQRKDQVLAVAQGKKISRKDIKIDRHSGVPEQIQIEAQT